MSRFLAITTLSVLLTLGVIACPPPDTRAPVPPAELTVGPPVTVAPGASGASPAGPVTEPSSHAATAPATTNRAAGAQCSASTECASGICEGWGCGADQGLCAPAQRGCTRDLRAYCGCDGQSFQASGSCPGQRYAYRGACAPPKPDGAICASDLQCESAICEGQGCGAQETGTCVRTGRVCTADVKEYCGCDGKSFHASGSCPGRRFANLGACR